MRIPFAIPIIYDRTDAPLLYDKINISIDTETLDLYECYVYSGGFKNQSKMIIKADFSLYSDIFMEFLKEKLV